MFNDKTNLYEGYIYVISNNINSRLYIGQTINTIFTRWTDHKCASKNATRYKTPLYVDIRNLGIEHFNYKEIEKIEAITKDELISKLNEKEKYYIELYKTSIDYGGYNTESGGRHTPKKVYQYDIDLNLLYVYDDLNIASESTGIEKGLIRHVCSHDRLSANNYVFCYEGDTPILPKSRQNRGARYIYNMKDIYGNIIKSFDRISDISSYLDLTNCKSGLLSAIKDQRRYHDYYWEQIQVN